MRFALLLLALVMSANGAESPFSFIGNARRSNVTGWPGAGHAWTPSNDIPNMHVWWSANDVALGNFDGPWVDRIQSLNLYKEGSSKSTTNHNLWGLRFHDAWVTNNTGFTINSNATFWVVYKEVGSDTIGTWIDSGGLVDGFYYRPAALTFSREVGGSLSSANLAAASTEQDVYIWANGDLYTNGVFCGTTSSNVFTSNLKMIGQVNTTDRKLRGYIQDIGFWTNKNASLSEIAALYDYSRTNKATNITANLTAWWKLDDGTGTNITDASGNGWTGWMASLNTTQPDWGNSQISNGVRFGGENLGQARATNWIIITNSTGLLNGATTGAMTLSISIWIRNYTNQSTGDPKVILSKVSTDALYSDNRYPGWRVHWDDSGVSTYFVQSNSATADYIWGTYMLQTRDTNWHHYVCTKDTTGSNLFQYVDGVLDTQAYLQWSGNPVTNWQSTNNVMMGWNFDTTSIPSDKVFGGWLDDVRIYNKVLTDVEIMSLYRWGRYHHKY